MGGRITKVDKINLRYTYIQESYNKESCNNMHFFHNTEPFNLVSKIDVWNKPYLKEQT